MADVIDYKIFGDDMQMVEVELQFVGGFRNALFGGEGLFLACVTGPGTVYLQTLPLARLADRMHSAARGHANEARGSGNIGGDIIGNLFR